MKHLQLIHGVMLGTQWVSMQLVQCSSSLGFARTEYLRITYLYIRHILQKQIQTPVIVQRQTLKQQPFFRSPGETPQFSSLEEVPVPGTNAWRRPGAMLKRQCYWCWGAIFGHPCRWDRIGIKTKTLKNVPPCLKLAWKLKDEQELPRQRRENICCR